MKFQTAAVALVALASVNGAPTKPVEEKREIAHVNLDVLNDIIPGGLSALVDIGIPTETIQNLADSADGIFKAFGQEMSAYLHELTSL